MSDTIIQCYAGIGCSAELVRSGEVLAAGFNGGDVLIVAAIVVTLVALIACMDYFQD